VPGRTKRWFLPAFVRARPGMYHPPWTRDSAESAFEAAIYGHLKIASGQSMQIVIYRARVTLPAILG